MIEPIQKTEQTEPEESILTEFEAMEEVALEPALNTDAGSLGIEALPDIEEIEPLSEIAEPIFSPEIEPEPEVVRERS